MAVDERNARRFSGRMKTAALVGAGIVVLLLVYVAAHAFWSSSRTVVATVPGEQKPWKLEVVNTTGESGLAQRVADHLRRIGYDVVDVRTSRATPPARTAFIDRAGRPDALTDLQTELELTPDRFRSELDKTLLLDVTVVIGNDVRTIPAFAAAIRR